MLKVISIAAIWAAEALGIFAEIYSAKLASTSLSMAPAILRGSLIFLPVCILIIFGYVAGYKAFGNIWIVSAISITSILVIEPVLDYAIFRQMPTLGAGVGFILGAIGFVFTLFF